MALYITFQDNRSIEWHVGESNPLQAGGVRFHQVAEVQADGHELDWINENMSLPRQAWGIRVVSWYGDDAKFIAGNLSRSPLPCSLTGEAGEKDV